MRTILPSIAVCIALLVGYDAVLRVLPPAWKIGSVGSQWEQNIMRAESLVHMSRPPAVLMAGSSVSYRLNDLPAGWYNLSFGGAGAMTGLELLRRDGLTPPVVLIEVNLLHIEPDQALLDPVLNPLFMRLRARLPALREANNPHLVGLRAARQLLPRSPASETPLRPDLRETLLAKRMDEISRPLDQAQLDVISARLHGLVDWLQARSVKVIFYEVPEHPLATDAPRPTSLRTRLLAEFPPDRYAWVAAQDASSYETSDPVHLTKSSATRYCRVLASEVRRLVAGASSTPARDP
jgi:hypothetical protein